MKEQSRQYIRPLVIAITGGMGCGQTTVAKFFQKWGAKDINADLVARQVVNQDPEVRKELEKAFGKHIFYRNGRLNRKLLARIVFQDESKTRRLNRIVHPRMVSRIIDEIEKAREEGKYPIIAIDAALIYELNLEHMFDYVVVVSSRMSQRIQRIKERDKIPEKEIIYRIQRQLPIEEKMKWGDFVIENNSSLEDLERKSRAVFRKLLNIQKRQEQKARRELEEHQPS